jgi:predicted RNA-binding protein (virulence factor B family)
MEVLRALPIGYFLDAGDFQVLLPRKLASRELQVGDWARVFIYNDSEDRLIATMLPPKAVVGDFVALQVKDVTDFGAFLDWGLEKDLLVPYKHQFFPLQKGENYVVHILLDERTKRIIATTKIEPFCNRDTSKLHEGQTVQLLIYNFTDLGIMAIVDNQYSGMLYRNEVFERLPIGAERSGYIKKIREDGKLDLGLNQEGYGVVTAARDVVLKALTDAGGFLPVHDKSNPTEIYDSFQMSKKIFKKTLGALYKARLITISETGIRLVKHSR